tara:strand:+ start:736 stop:927 length:192 start_codon:yes stop_codon:yes gene_type:complete
LSKHRPSSQKKRQNIKRLHKKNKPNKPYFSPSERMNELSKLKENGMISDKEYEKKRGEILNDL